MKIANFVMIASNFAIKILQWKRARFTEAHITENVARPGGSHKIKDKDSTKFGAHVIKKRDILGPGFWDSAKTYEVHIEIHREGDECKSWRKKTQVQVQYLPLCHLSSEPQFPYF